MDNKEIFECIQWIQHQQSKLSYVSYRNIYDDWGPTFSDCVDSGFVELAWFKHGNCRSKEKTFFGDNCIVQLTDLGRLLANSM